MSNSSGGTVLTRYPNCIRLMAFGAALFCPLALRPQTDIAPVKLKLHQRLVRESGPGRSETFAVEAGAGQFVHIMVRKQGVDVSVTVKAPDRGHVLSVNSPSTTFGPELASWIAERAGVYRVTVAKSALSAETGKFEIRWMERRAPAVRDSQQIEAERVLEKAVAADRVGSKESNQEALTLYERSRVVWHGLGDRVEEGLCLHRMGWIHAASGENQKALEHYKQALALRHAARDRMGEANTLNNIGLVYAEIGQRQKAMEYYSQALTIVRALGDHAGAVRALNNMGDVYQNLGDNQKAGEYYAEALSHLRAVGNRWGEAEILNKIGIVFYNIGARQKAIDYFNRALPIWREVGDRQGEAKTLNSIGLAYTDLGEGQKALGYYNHVLPIERELQNHKGEATTLMNMGNAYDHLGKNQEALKSYGQALSIYRDIGDHGGEANSLSDMGVVYEALGEKQKALELYTRVLPIYRSVGDRSGEALALNNIGVVYEGLGDDQKALESYNQALPLYRAVGDRSGEARALTNVARIHFGRQEIVNAVDHLNQALPIFRAAGDRSGEAAVLNSIGIIWSHIGNKQEALEAYQQSLPVYREAGNLTGEATTLNNIGVLYWDSGEKEKALEYYNQALTIHRSIGNRSDEALTLNNLRKLYSGSAPALAVVFGKQAVNVLQSIRRDSLGLNAELRQSYTKSIESSYRDLASLLVGLSRFAEAEEVLNLLKDEEAANYIRRDAVADKLRAATLLDFEKDALKRYDENIDRIVSLGQRKAELLTKRKQGALSAVEVAESQKLDADLTAANTVVNRFLADEERAFAPGTALAKEVVDLKQAESVQRSLQKLGPKAVAIYTLVAGDEYIAMLVTSGARKAYVTRISQADLNQKLFAFRQALQNPASNLVPLAQELYRILLPEGLPADLEKIGATSVMWSLDSTLRYVPMGALHDGKGYLVERFRNTLITPESLASLTDDNSGEWLGAGFGVSEAHPGFSALPSVPEELRRIFGVVAGSVRMDAEFKKGTLQQDLAGKVNPIVHIATHFDAEPGVAANSNLLLGDGTKLSLAEIEATTRLFDGVDLLTLSACSTGFQIGTADGREVDSLGTIAQRLGAKGVIASLWNVSDEATAVLMQTLYRNWKEHPDKGKGEALRLAQAQMANGALRPSAKAALGSRGVVVAGSHEMARDWQHPYYWAAFILIGNWK